MSVREMSCGDVRFPSSHSCGLGSRATVTGGGINPRVLLITVKAAGTSLEVCRLTVLVDKDVNAPAEAGRETTTRHS